MDATTWWMRLVIWVASLRRRKGAGVKVYLAGPYPWKQKLRSHAASLRVRGVQVVSEWLDEPDGLSFAGIDPMEARFYAERDKGNINDCDIFVLFVGDAGGGGKDWETGYAYYIAKEIIIIGKPRNVFHYLPECLVFDTWACAARHIVDLADSNLEWLENQE
jgi:nucleoside 2-deoxyribosyltransferase